MCGIAGFLTTRSGNVGAETVVKMTDAISHRGPDDAGCWSDPEEGIYVGHRRLSVLDLSPAGHQPMMSKTGSLVLAFNGEIYNHSALRAELGTDDWRGHSDTETLLACFERWGVHEALKKTTGMFAMALWDRKNRTLSLIRDRMGEKPLYYGWQGPVFLFGSELKAFKAHPQFPGDIDRTALALMLRYGYVPAPYSIYRGIYKLAPGAVLELGSTQNPGTLPEPVPYWSLPRMSSGPGGRSFTGTDSEAIDELESILKSSISDQMIADVPLGAFLSGGIDSSAVVALMQSQSARPVKTFTIGFHEHGYNEAEHAGEVAHHLGTEHTELYVTPDDAIQIIPRLPMLYDEPFADSSQIPTFLVSQMTRRHVTVALSGDGGDELFCGYGRYFRADAVWRKIESIPRILRRAVAKGVHLTPSALISAGLYPLAAMRNPRNRQPAGARAHALADVLECRGPEDFYRTMTSHWRSPADVIRDIPAAPDTPGPFGCGSSEKNGNFVEHMMYIDASQYLPDDILVKVDRAAMSVSLETRVPFLDHHVVEYAWRLPLSLKVRDGQGKWILRQILYKYVPKELVERPKMGFGVPVDVWLRGPLRDWAEDLLNEERMRSDGFLLPEPIRKRWRQHLSGRYNWSGSLWNVLVFQAWLTYGRN